MAGKNVFLATLAHELRNPLAPIRNATAILKSKVGECPQLKWCSEVIERQVGHMSRLLDDLLDVSRITQGKLHLKIITANLEAIISQAVEEAQPQIEDNQRPSCVAPGTFANGGGGSCSPGASRREFARQRCEVHRKGRTDLAHRRLPRRPHHHCSGHGERDPSESSFRCL